MAFVKLKKNWFDPNGQRHRVRDGMFQVPDDWIKLLPTSAEVFDDKGKELPSKGFMPVVKK